VEPAADDARVAVLYESALAEAFAESVVVGEGRDGGDHVDVVGCACRGRCGVGEPEVDARAAEEDDLVE
jgi:hypothetical protein